MIPASHTISRSQIQFLTSTTDNWTWKSSFDSQADCQDSHEGLVGHGINDCTNYSLEVPSPGDVAVNKIRDSCISK